VAGPLEVFGLALARKVFLAPAVVALCARQRFSFTGNAPDYLHGANGSAVDLWGEDPIIGYLAHFAGTLYGFNYTLAHMTATKMHNRAPFPTMRDATRWALPATSIVVHLLKSAPRDSPRHAWLRTATHVHRRCFPPFLFGWHPRTHTLTNHAVDAWARYVALARRSTFGLHWLRNGSTTRQLGAIERFCEHT